MMLDGLRYMEVVAELTEGTLLGEPTVSKASRSIGGFAYRQGCSAKGCTTLVPMLSSVDTMTDERTKYAEEEEQQGEGISARLVDGRLGLCTKQRVGHPSTLRSSWSLRHATVIKDSNGRVPKSITIKALSHREGALCITLYVIMNHFYNHRIVTM